MTARALDLGRRGLIAQAQRRRARVEPIGDRDRSNEGLGRTALVTGASSGIGRDTARLLGARGWDVVVIARNVDRLMALQSELQSRYGVRVLPLACDLADESAPAEICAFLDSENVSIDLLINNAGYTMVGDFADHPRIGEYLAPGLPISIDGEYLGCTPAPALGDDSDDVLRDFGMTDSERADLFNAGTVA
jgi:NAD(P)-dependent dehydrogenase (short-subunit alcohol dehydrogenase family)